MSATLVQGNTNLAGLSGSRSLGVNVIAPVMAVSVCRPPASSNGMPSRRGSAIGRSQLPANSLPINNTHFKLHSQESLHAASSLSSSLLVPYPPVEDTTWASDSREGLTLPRISSPVQLCSTTNSQSSFITTIDATSGKDGIVDDVDAHLEKSNPPSIFPNFRALQRLAVSAKLRINNLKSKEAKAITALLNQENHNNQSHSCQDDVIQVNNVLNSSWESQDDDDLTQYPHINNTDSAVHSEKGTSKSKTKKFYRSRSRRRGGKTPSKKKHSPAPTKDHNSLGDFSLASTMTLNSRWERKKVETFSTKFNKGFTSRKSKVKDSSSGTSSQVSLTTVALEKRSNATTPRAITKQSRSEASDSMPTPRQVLEHAASVYGSGNHIHVRLSNKFRSSESERSMKKVFLSEKQSSMLKDGGKGVPCAPPTSPTPQQLEKFEYIASLTDLRSQRALKDRLNVIGAEEKKKSQKIREDKARQEKQSARNNVGMMRQRQRQEIYALNKVMTELENSHFQKFCEAMNK
ncbi:uncharacterized protein LOC100891071 [Strongylocentrotus purpuratus]|uniref:Small vasohibin-binding protein n=1 Tax=Strongylocentrotus purpuratus TaxID=7668 RepID=A0A7M7GJ03_STRPU|nr:uncharacterized protein LOC100891071 [Strongylocentrotus purpuratus]